MFYTIMWDEEKNLPFYRYSIIFCFSTLSIECFQGLLRGSDQLQGGRGGVGDDQGGGGREFRHRQSLGLTDEPGHRGDGVEAEGGRV